MEVTVSPPSEKNREKGILPGKWIIDVVAEHDGRFVRQTFTTDEEPSEGVIYTCKAIMQREMVALGLT